MIARWTIGGKVSNEGIECLHHSVDCWSKLYPSSRLIVCYNGIDPSLLPDVELINQTQYVNSLPFPPNGCNWKVYPSRIDINDHEIFIDNDLVIYGQSSIIDEFLVNKDMNIITEGIHRNYGEFDKLVPLPYKINNGFFGVMPGFDLEKEIRAILVRPWGSYFSDQGACATIITKYNHKIVPRSELHICDSDIKHTDVGMHFVGLNSGRTKFWNEYKSILNRSNAII